MLSSETSSCPPAFKDPTAEMNETIYLCNFRVSVDGEWLCLKELEDFGTVVQAKGKNFPSTPEFEQIVRYPDYPLGRKGLTNSCLCLRQ